MVVPNVTEKCFMLKVYQLKTGFTIKGVHLVLLVPNLSVLVTYAMVQMATYIANHVMLENLELQVTEVNIYFTFSSTVLIS